MRLGLIVVAKMNYVSRKLGYENCLAVDRIGFRGSLVLLWKDKA